MTLADIKRLTNVKAGDRVGNVDLTLPQQQTQDPYAGSAMMMPSYNPFSSGMPKSWDAICMDRMVTIHRPKGIKKGLIWLTESDFAETLSLLPLNRVEQRHLIRKFRKAMMTASGELSKEEVYQRQELLFAEIVSQKSRLDVVPGGNLNERLSWITSTQQFETIIKGPPPVQSKGFFSSVASNLTGRG